MFCNINMYKIHNLMILDVKHFFLPANRQQFQFTNECIVNLNSRYIMYLKNYFWKILISPSSNLALKKNWKIYDLL